MAHRDWDNPATMIGVDEVLDRVLAAVEPLPAVRVALLDSRGMVLAGDVVAATNVPPFRNSAMDGFALRASDTAARLPAELRLIGTIPAGSDPGLTVEHGQAARIMTGAPLPPGADAVIRFEEVEQRGDSTIQIGRAVSRGENVREAGEDVGAGTTVLRKGRVIRAQEIGLLAALNIEQVEVHRRPRVGILSTGDEVVDLGPELKPGQIRDANTYTLTAMVQELGGEPVALGVAADSHQDLRERMGAARDCDLIVTSGGVSHGDFDLVKDVLRQEGQINVWTVRIKPGKPLAFGTLGSVPLLGLPGNPAAAVVSFDQFGRPAILKMLGMQRYRLPVVRAVLTEAVNNRGRRRHFERAILWREQGEWRIRPTGIHGSAMLTSLTAANCYLIVPEDMSEVRAGSVVEAQILDAQSVVGMLADDDDVIARESD